MATNKNLAKVDPSTAPLTVPQIKARIQRIQQVMRGVMKEGVHFGKIPGAGERRSLFKAGAEVLGVTFHIASAYRIEDLSDEESERYRVTCVGTHQVSGTILGEGMGAASSNEEKYKWRAAINEAEFEDTDSDRKRTKWKRGGQNGPDYQVNQVRAEPADIDNTVLKMACKRAQVAMIINVTGASDIFAQDLEDLPDGADGGAGSGRRGKPDARDPKAAAGDPNRKATESQVKLLNARLAGAKVDTRKFCEQFKVDAVVDVPFARVNEAIDWINANGA